MTESLYRYSPLYGEYLLLHFPVLGFLKAMVIIVLLLWLYPDRPMVEDCTAIRLPEKITRKEKRLSVVLFGLMLLWATDFIHHISPAWIALSGAVFLLLPKIEIVSQKQFTEKVNYNSLLFIAGILGLGSIISHTGLGDLLAKHLISQLPLSEHTPFINFVSLSLSSLLTGVVTTLPGVPAVLTPLAEELANATGLPLNSVVMTQVVGFSTPLFPYQAPPILVGMQLAQVNLFEAFKVCLYLAIVSIIVLLPLNYLWWRHLGWL
jgi:di/tricarboxylate transporter